MLNTTLFVFSYLFLSATANGISTSFSTKVLQTLVSFVLAFNRIIEVILKWVGQKKEKQQQNVVLRVLLVAAPIIIGLLFLKLYQAADANFKEWTAFLNLNWISWGFFGFYFFIFIFFYGTYYFTKSSTFDDVEADLPDNIPNNTTDSLFKYLGKDNEIRLAKSILITLIVLLTAYVLIDLKTISTDLLDATKPQELSAFVHSGINNLITSIILVFIIVTILFRGQLNYLEKPLIKILGFFWLLLNIAMCFTTMVKNYTYIAEYGLTFKRIGVYIYLGMAIIGLCITIYKVFKKHSLWFLLRAGILNYFILFSLIGLFNWSSFITRYNLKQIPYDKLDIPYLISFGTDAYPSLIDYQNETENIPEYIFVNIELPYEVAYFRMKNRADNRSWKSQVIREENYMQHYRSTKK